MKTCIKCGVEKPEGECLPRRNICRACNADYLREWRAKNPEKFKASRDAWKKRNPERVRESARADWAKHREKRLAYDRERYQWERERRYKNTLAWKKRNPDKVLSYTSRYFARRRGAQTEAVSRTYIIERDRSRCHICGGRARREDIHLDHLVPLSKGGEHSSRNLRVAHSWCNQQRSDGRLPAQLLLIG